MKQLSPEVTAYIARAPEYARPILTKLRTLLHRGSKDLQESLKWGCPHFEYKGLVAGMAAFKHYVRVGFWKGALLPDPQGAFERMGGTTMGAAKVTSLRDLPPDMVFVRFVRAAVALNEQGVKVPASTRQRPKPKPKAPPYLLAALRKKPPALANFRKFSPSHQREYILWLTEAKQEATRERRLATAVAWIAAGKTRHWKYQRQK